MPNSVNWVINVCYSVSTKSVGFTSITTTTTILYSCLLSFFSGSWPLRPIRWEGGSDLHELRGQLQRARIHTRMLWLSLKEDIEDKKPELRTSSELRREKKGCNLEEESCTLHITSWLDLFEKPSLSLLVTHSQSWVSISYTFALDLFVFMSILCVRYL